MAAVIKERELAPRNAIVSYNFGVLLGQTGQAEETEEAFEEAITLKPDFYGAYDTLAKLYHILAVVDRKTPEASVSAEETIVNPMWQQKAIDTYRRFLTSPYYMEILKKQGKSGW